MGKCNIMNVQRLSFIAHSSLSNAHCGYCMSTRKCALFRLIIYSFAFKRQWVHLSISSGWYDSLSLSSPYWGEKTLKSATLLLIPHTKYIDHQRNFHGSCIWYWNLSFVKLFRVYIWIWIKCKRWHAWELYNLSTRNDVQTI